MNIDKITTNWNNEYKSEILEIIDNNFDNKGLSELIDWLNNDIDYNGALSEHIDSSINIYYYDLRKWFVDNYDYVEDAIKEFGKSEDIHKDIQMGQYLYYSELYNEAIQDLIEHIQANYKV